MKMNRRDFVKAAGAATAVSKKGQNHLMGPSLFGG